MNDFPSVIINKIGTNIYESHSYDIWLDRYVNKGIAHEYHIVQYPDLSELIIFDDKGIEIKRKHVLIANAVNLSKENPSKYEFRRLNIEALKKEHLDKSRKIAKTKPNMRLAKQVFYFLSFLLIIPLFSKKSRVAINRYINVNINMITVIGVIVTVVFAAIQTLRMFNII